MTAKADLIERQNFSACPNCGNPVSGLTARYCDDECNRLAVERRTDDRMRVIPDRGAKNIEVIHNPVPVEDGGFRVGAAFAPDEYEDMLSLGSFDLNTIILNTITQKKYLIRGSNAYPQ